MTRAPLRVVVVGLGRRGLQWLAALKGSDSIEVVAGIEPEAWRRDRARPWFPFPQQRMFVRLDMALRAWQPDAAIVCTPLAGREALVAEALQGGLSVLVEKPLAISSDRARKMVDVAKKAGRGLVVAHNYRYSPPYWTCRQLVQAGKIGEPQHVEIADLRRLPADLNPMATASHSHLDMAAHPLDALRFILEDEAATVSARAFNPTGSGYQHGSALHAMITMRSGVEISYVGSFTSYETRVSLTVHGTKGIVRTREGSVTLIPRAGRRRRVKAAGRLPADAGRAPTWGMASLIDELVAAHRSGTSGINAASSNLGTVSLLEAIVESDRAGAPVCLHVPPATSARISARGRA